MQQNKELCMQREHEGRVRQVLAFFAGACHSMKRPGHHTQIALYDRKTTTTPGASQHSHISCHQLQRGGPISQHTDRKATNTTITKPRRYENWTASGPHTN